MSTYLDVILYLRPGAQVALVGGEAYENIAWGQETPIPKADLDAAFAATDASLAQTAKQRQVVSMRQARLALLEAGLLSKVNDALAAMAGAEGEAARIEWEYAAEVKRSSPQVASLSAALGLSEAQLDALFTKAASM